MAVDPVLSVLQASLQEKAEVLVCFRSGHYRGLVARVDEQSVELHDKTQSCVIRLEAIDAVVKG